MKTLHAADRPFRCGVCQQSFLSAEGLKRHVSFGGNGNGVGSNGSGKGKGLSVEEVESGEGACRIGCATFAGKGVQ
jgi:hypothetical protein